MQDVLAATDAPAKKKHRRSARATFTTRCSSRGSSYRPIVLSFIGIGGIVTLAWGATGVIGANRNLQKLEPTDTDAIAVEHEYRDKQRKILYSGLGLTLGGGGLGALFILLFDRGPPRVRVTPTVGRTHAGVHLLVRF